MIWYDIIHIINNIRTIISILDVYESNILIIK